MDERKTGVTGQIKVAEVQQTKLWMEYKRGEEESEGSVEWVETSVRGDLSQRTQEDAGIR